MHEGEWLHLDRLTSLSDMAATLDGQGILAIVRSADVMVEASLAKHE